jgi:hypothetical protein
MALLMRKRNRKVKLTSRMGSRRNRLLVFTIFSLLVAAVWVSGIGATPAGKYFLVARNDLSSYTQLSEANFDSVLIDLKDESQKYVQTESKLSSWFLAKPIRAGELIPASALVPEPVSNCTAMKLSLGVTLNSGIHTGDLLDIWSGQPNYTSNSIPVQIVSGAELLSSNTTTDALSQNVQTIEVCVNQAEIRSVVNAIAQKFVVIAVLATL